MWQDDMFKETKIIIEILTVIYIDHLVLSVKQIVLFSNIYL